MKIEWKLGQQICRDPNYGEVELLHVNLSEDYPLLIVYRKSGVDHWNAARLKADGRSSPSDLYWFDIIPPRMTRCDVIREVSLHLNFPIVDHGILKILDCYDALIKSGQYVPWEKF